MDELVDLLRHTARADPNSTWFDVVTLDHISYFENALDLALPDLLKRCYTEVSNGGFGPGYGVAGLPGGHEAAWGDLAKSVVELRSNDGCEDSLIPIIDWGCNKVTCVDCDDGLIVTFLEGSFHHEDYTFDSLMKRWCMGEIPNPGSGVFDN